MVDPWWMFQQGRAWVSKNKAPSPQLPAAKIVHSSATDHRWQAKVWAR